MAERTVAVWRLALGRMPRVTPEEWARLGPLTRWLVATRAAALVMTLCAALVAGLLAWRDGAFDGVRFAVMSLGLLLAHATNNLLNDLTDTARGVDRDDYFRTRYGAHPLEHGLLTRRTMWLYASLTGAAALACGAYLTAVGGVATLALLAAGAFFVLFYTYPLKYVGLGEPAVLLVWGPLMVGGGYLVVTGRLDAGVIVASLPYALGPTSVLFGKHIDKLDADRTKGIRTLPVLLGERAARRVVPALVALQYALVLALVATRALSPAALVVALAAGRARWLFVAFARPRPDAPPPQFPPDVWPAWYVAFAFHHTRLFGALYGLAIFADALLRRIG